MEVFGGWGWSTYVSPRELAKMKKNMKKVPLIQAKSDIQLQKDMKDAEDQLAQADQEIAAGEQKTIIVEEGNEKNLKRWESVWNYVKEWFEKISSD